jgi:hypothetical protein
MITRERATKAGYLVVHYSCQTEYGSLSFFRYSRNAQPLTTVGRILKGLNGHAPSFLFVL